MTVTYSNKISTTSFCLFGRLLLRWRGSVFKLIWKDLVLYLMLYASCSVVYRLLLTEDQKRIFEKVALAFDSYMSGAPISFILGFYVSIVVARWWDQYMLIPWPDDLCILVSALVQGKDARCRALRRAIARYINLAFVLSFTRISSRIVIIYPTYEELVKKGYLTVKEKKIMEMMDEVNNHHQVWDPLPLLWASLAVVQARKEGYIPDDHSQEALIHEITKLRYSCSKLQEFNHMSVPLVYTQVTTMATYSYFFCSVISRQFLDPAQGYKSNLIDFYIPIYSILLFIFYMGWLKVAESLLNPFGNDDDDFDTHLLLERHLEVSYLIVDDMHLHYPHLLEDLTFKPNHNNQNSKANNHHNFDTNFSSLDPTNDLNSKGINIGKLILDTHRMPDITSSQESFCSTATAVPNFSKLTRSQSCASIQSSSNCSYNSCLSLIRQNSRSNSKYGSSISAMQTRRTSILPKTSSLEKGELSESAEILETLELMQYAT